MGTERRAFLGATVGALVARAAGAQPVRSGVVRLMLGFSAGGAADRVARVLAPELGRVAGRNVIVENVPGANGGRAIQRVAQAEPDGDTLLFATSAIAHPDHAAAIEALRPVVLVSTTPMVVVVRGGLPARDAKEFVRWLVAHPGATYGSAGIGNATHLCAADLVERLGATATHVPYSGTTPAFGDLMGGHIDFLVMGATPSLAQQGAVRMVAVTTRRRSRLPGLDQLPTVAEMLGGDFDHSLWQAVYAPERVSATVRATLETQFREILALDAVRAALADAGSEPIAGGPDAADRMFRAEAARIAARASR